MQVFVGKLDTDVPDATVKRLLETLGDVLTWKRTTDESGKPKGFGYCTFANPDSVLRAMRLLNGFKMGAKAILVKADQNTSAKLEEYKAGRGDSHDAEAETKADAELRERIVDILSGKAPAAAPSAADIPQPAPVALVDAEPHVQSEIEKFRSAELVRQSEMERRRRERLQERVEASKRKERQDAAREMEKKVEQELAKLKDASSSSSSSSSSSKDISQVRDRRYDDHRDRRDRRDYDRDRGSGRDDRDRKRRRFDGEEGEVSEYRYEGPESLQLAAPSSSSSQQIQPPAQAPKSTEPVKLGFGFGAMSKKKETKPVAAKMKMFQVDEEEGKKTMKQLVPLDYTEEEMMAAKPVADRVAAVAARISKGTEQTAHTTGGKTEAPPSKPAAMNDVKSLIDRIPTEKAELFAYPLDWAAVDKHRLVEAKMKPWVVKKIIEYLGEKEETLIDFVTSKLEEHSPPGAILEELSLVLEEDAEVFVVKMWRMLVFETLRAGTM